MINLIKQFGNDPETIAIVVLIVVDFLFGVSAAVVSKTQSVNLTYLADFLRADVLSKLVPYAGLWFLFQVSGDVNLGELELLETGTSAAIILALVASVLKSLADLGVPIPGIVAKPDPTTPG